MPTIMQLASSTMSRVEVPILLQIKSPIKTPIPRDKQDCLGEGRKSLSNYLVQSKS